MFAERSNWRNTQRCILDGFHPSGGLLTALRETPREAAHVSRTSPSRALPVVRSGAWTLPGPSAPTASRGEATASVGAASDGGPHHRRGHSWLTARDTNRRRTTLLSQKGIGGDGTHSTLTTRVFVQMSRGAPNYDSDPLDVALQNPHCHLLASGQHRGANSRVKPAPPRNANPDMACATVPHHAKS